jgi:hypothetical protein
VSVTEDDDEALGETVRVLVTRGLPELDFEIVPVRDGWGEREGAPLPVLAPVFEMLRDFATEGDATPVPDAVPLPEALREALPV